MKNYFVINFNVRLSPIGSLSLGRRTELSWSEYRIEMLAWGATEVGGLTYVFVEEIFKLEFHLRKNKR